MPTLKYSNGTYAGDNPGGMSYTQTIYAEPGNGGNFFAPVVTVIYGDFSSAADQTDGATDYLFASSGGQWNQFFLVGDSAVATGNTTGAYDIISAGFGLNNLYDVSGDFDEMFDNSVGGDDLIIVGNGEFSGQENGIYWIRGDASMMYGHSQGGDDLIVANSTSGTVHLRGEARKMFGDSRGGDDTLFAGDGDGTYDLRGEANAMYDNSVGGNDRLVSGDGTGTYTLIGDAAKFYDNARGGDDILESGTARDEMWGDAREYLGDGQINGGADTFLFKQGSNHDVIHDFRSSDGDRIDVSDYGYSSMADFLMFASGDDTVIDFGGGNTVTVVDVYSLSADDFIFA